MHDGGTQLASMVVLDDGDNVGVALCDITAGAVARDRAGRTILAAEDIPQGHKLALAPIACDAPVLRFGMTVGRATRGIGTGHLVHIHNVRSQYLTNDRDHFE